MKLEVHNPGGRLLGWVHTDGRVLRSWYSIKVARIDDLRNNPELTFEHLELKIVERRAIITDSEFQQAPTGRAIVENLRGIPEAHTSERDMERGETLYRWSVAVVTLAQYEVLFDLDIFEPADGPFEGNRHRLGSLGSGVVRHGFLSTIMESGA